VNRHFGPAALTWEKTIGNAILGEELMTEEGPDKKNRGKSKFGKTVKSAFLALSAL